MNSSNSKFSRKLCYLGPEGSFTHQAALKVQQQLQSFENLRLIPIACENVLSIASEIEEHNNWGVIAWENNIEGVVIPNLDLLIDAKNMVGIARVGVDISFDAVICKSDSIDNCSTIVAHPHVLAPRDQALDFVNVQRENFSSFSSIIAFIPRCTGAGVLANLLDVVRDHGLNMTSFMSRPIKGRGGLYSFIATVDSAPWDSMCKDMIQEVVEHGDWVRVLAVYSSDKRKNPVMDDWMLPHGGVCVEPSVDALRNLNVMRAERELLW